MKHQVELKFPKLFGRKEIEVVDSIEDRLEKIEEKFVEEDSKDRIEMAHSLELKMPELFGKAKVEIEETIVKHKKMKKQFAIIGGSVVVSFAMGYVIGHNKGASKTPINIIINK